MRPWAKTRSGWVLLTTQKVRKVVGVEVESSENGCYRIDIDKNRRGGRESAELLDLRSKGDAMSQS